MRMVLRLALDLPPACHDAPEVGVRQAAPDLKASHPQLVLQDTSWAWFCLS